MQRQTDTANADRFRTHWYEVPLIWISLGIFSLMLFGCIHLILLSLNLPDEQLYPDTVQPDNPAFFRMPLHPEMPSEPVPTQADNSSNKS